MILVKKKTSSLTSEVVLRLLSKQNYTITSKFDLKYLLTQYRWSFIALESDLEYQLIHPQVQKLVKSSK